MTDHQELRRLCEAASPGKWAAFNMVHEERGDQMTPEEIGEYVANSVRKSQSGGDAERFLFISAHPGDGPDICLVGNGPLGPHNAAFIAASRQAIPQLLDQSESDKATIERLRGALEKVHGWLVCAPLATADDMAQSFGAMELIARSALNGEG